MNSPEEKVDKSAENANYRPPPNEENAKDGPPRARFAGVPSSSAWRQAPRHPDVLMFQTQDGQLSKLTTFKGTMKQLIESSGVNENDNKEQWQTFIKVIEEHQATATIIQDRF